MNSIRAKLRNSLPAIITWIDQTLMDYADTATPVSECPFLALRGHYPKELLTQSRVVLVPKVPFPPLSRIGLSEFQAMETMMLDGVTYKTTFFVRDGRQSASLYFHELVHVTQWARLGAHDFLLAYGAGLVQYGYEKSPLEEMAYRLQSGFDQGQVPLNLVKYIEEQTDTVWSAAQKFLLEK